MMNWFLDDLWLEQSMPWYLPPPPQLIYSNNNSPVNSFREYIYPIVDRISPTFTGDNLLDYYDFYSNRTPHIQKPAIKSNRLSKTVNQNYQIFNCIGKGGFGHVFEGRRKSDNHSVVLKFLPKDRIVNWGTFEGKRIPYEIEVLCRLRGISGIIRIFEHFEEPERFIFSMEKIPNSCTLFDFVRESPSLANTELLRHIFREIISLNIILQTYGVWHRDCKPENILYCKNDRSLRLIDFGSAAPTDSGDFHEFQGTLEIMVPEWILQKRYSGEKACVWTLGVCLYFLLFQQYPFRSKLAIVHGRSRLPFSTSTDKEAYNTMKQCLNGNEYRRPKLNSLQHLSWLNKSLLIN